MPFTNDDIDTLEGNEDASREDEACARQRAINAGMWSLQGSYGRSMMAAIEAGDCMLGEHDARDYWGNHIPSRSQVQAGTKGSREFVVEHNGEAWAAMLDAA